VDLAVQRRQVMIWRCNVGVLPLEGGTVDGFDHFILAHPVEQAGQEVRAIPADMHHDQDRKIEVCRQEIEDGFEGLEAAG